MHILIHHNEIPNQLNFQAVSAADFAHLIVVFVVVFFAFVSVVDDNTWSENKISHQI